MSIINLFKHASALRLLRSLLTLAFLLILVANSQARAQERSENDEPGDIALYQALLDLTNPWTVMCVAAHPDDEDGATLTLLRRGYGVHTVTLFSTYGEGGQNAIGPDLYEELGAIRARETTKAARFQGSEPYFLGLPDFGFSKSADEALKVWGHDEALRRMVLQIRTLRPDVIITNHDTVSGHGHHQATGRLVLEAFDAAADPNRFPEQLRENGLSTWQVQRLLVRANFEGGAGSKTAEEEAERSRGIVSIDPNERDTVRGLTYAEQSLRALQQHASQGPWPKAVPAAGAPVRRYRLVRAAKSSAPLPVNAPSLLGGMSLPTDMAERLMPLAAKALLPVYVANGRKSQGVLAALIAARKGGLFSNAGQASDTARMRLMTERLDRALALASGIRVTLAPREEVLVPDTTTSFSWSITNQGEREARIVEIDFQDLRNESNIETPKTLAPGATLNLIASRFVPRDATLSVPHTAHLYDGLIFGHQFGVRVYIEEGGVRFPVAATTRLDVAPAVEIVNVSPSPYVWTPATLNREMTFKLRLTSHLSAPFKGEIVISSPANSISEAGPRVSLGPKETREVVFKSNVIPVDTPDERRIPRPRFDTLQIKLHRDNSTDAVAQRDVPVIYSDAQVAPGLRVGYVPSYDESLRDALAALGVESRELKIEDVLTGDLASYDTIIIDNRGYQAHPELISSNARLLDYVRAGGTLVVFYHKTNEWNPDPRAERPQLAPYPLTLGNSRVTDENALVTFTDPQHALLRWPNKINADDFRGWIQERGLYYPQSWDKWYSALLSMSDGKEAPLRGGLLAADYG
ncbi:MAG: PIG-L family deacetylase, partial [Acidobacteria bacterium]|nr:PIG-L family deacetylase [Acidobacteriota bacterium]